MSKEKNLEFLSQFKWINSKLEAPETADTETEVQNKTSGQLAMKM